MFVRWIAHYCLIGFLWVAGAAFAAAPGNATRDLDAFADYRLGPGDTVLVEVFGEPDLTVTTKIPQNGRLSYPFLGAIPATGMTPKQLETIIRDGLAGDYLVDPKVTVTVSEYRPVFVNGQVKTPGSFPFQPGLTVRKAVSLAGGLTERASDKRISLIAEGDTQKRQVAMDALVSPGDIVTVEESFF
ncbi:capsular biosynthesis protein [Ahniella affigens]|uniref:Capsular biosynthesis protein n=1 Tax=Ahniella affigens TaxID=2021234 RepID=A0A2P1PU71_9GAMM|nr:polysaccharide biosynthesis/export family protein [Ahniella affigens]AVP98388.1 capsular biosynthesis protein [Ahniella affigens]